MYNEYLLNNDRYSRKLNEEDHVKIIEKAKKTGKYFAEFYSIDKIHETLKEDGFTFEYVENNKESKFIYFRARILVEKTKKTIYIYEDTVIKAAKKYNMKTSFFRDLYVAHEFFHYLEYKKTIILSYKIIRNTFLGKNFYGNVDAISEIGANYFAMSVMKTDFNPMKLDLEEKDVQL